MIIMFINPCFRHPFSLTSIFAPSITSFLVNVNQYSYPSLLASYRIFTCISLLMYQRTPTGNTIQKYKPSLVQLNQNLTLSLTPSVFTIKTAQLRDYSAISPSQRCSRSVFLKHDWAILTEWACSNFDNWISSRFTWCISSCLPGQSFYSPAMPPENLEYRSPISPLRSFIGEHAECWEMHLFSVVLILRSLLRNIGITWYHCLEISIF